MGAGCVDVSAVLGCGARAVNGEVWGLGRKWWRMGQSGLRVFHGAFSR